MERWGGGKGVEERVCIRGGGRGVGEREGKGVRKEGDGQRREEGREETLRIERK